MESSDCQYDKVRQFENMNEIQHQKKERDIEKDSNIFCIAQRVKEMMEYFSSLPIENIPPYLDQAIE